MCIRKEQGKDVYEERAREGMCIRKEQEKACVSGRIKEKRAYQSKKEGAYPVRRKEARRGSLDNRHLILLGPLALGQTAI
jgi:hypothetical protein